jgi:hypothetical protein
MRGGVPGCALVAAACIALAVGTAASAGRSGDHPEPPSLAAGAAFGLVPAVADVAVPAAEQAAQAAQDAKPAQQGKGAKARQQPGPVQLQYHGGPVQSGGTAVYPIYWGGGWSSSYAAIPPGLDTFYQGIGGSAYAKTNTEYTDGSGGHVSSAVTWVADSFDSSAAPAGNPSTKQLLAEVAKLTHNQPVAGAYYPVYSDQPRGVYGYCAWHSGGTINGIRIEVGFFFSLAGDPGCDPRDTVTGHGQQLASLANVSGHELSETLTDPQLNAWYDSRGNENADKCAWTFDGTVDLGGTSWKVQGNWSNAAAVTNSGYGVSIGCIQASTAPY